MPIQEFRCPECDVDVEMALPRAATVKAVRDRAEEPDDSDRKERSLVCRNDHEFHVVFEF